MNRKTTLWIFGIVIAMLFLTWILMHLLVQSKNGNVGNVVQNSSALHAPYTRENNSVYFYGKKTGVSDPATFEVLGDVFSKDKNTLYHVLDVEAGDATGDNGPTLLHIDNYSNLNIDLPTFVELANTIRGAYAKDKNHIYYDDLLSGTIEIFDADLSTFTILNNCYAKDKDNIYTFLGSKMDSVDLPTFFVFDRCYSKDKMIIYNFFGEKIELVDSATTVSLGSGYFKDKNHVYHDDLSGHLTLVLNADPKTFFIPINNQ